MKETVYLILTWIGVFVVALFIMTVAWGIYYLANIAIFNSNSFYMTWIFPITSGLILGIALIQAFKYHAPSNTKQASFILICFMSVISIPYCFNFITNGEYFEFSKNVSLLTGCVIGHLIPPHAAREFR